MRRRHWIGIVVAVGLAGLLVGANGDVKPEPARVGVCDIHKALTGYKRLSDLRTQVEANEKAFRDEAKRRQEVVEQLLEQVSAINKDSPDYVKRDQEAWQKIYEVKAFQEVEQNKLERARRDGLQACYEDLIAVIKQYSAEVGLDVVHYSAAVPLEASRNVQELESLINSRRLLYTSQRVDITEVITQRLNAEWEKRQGGQK